MAKKRNEKKETTIEDFYDLKIDKVDELVAALKEGEAASDAPEISTKIADCTGEATPDTKTKHGKDKEFNPYKIDKLAKIPTWVKALFIKFWFAGAVCYFVNMGLGVYVKAALDLMVLDGIILGMLTDFIVNSIYRMMESDRKEFNNYMMFPFPIKHFWTFFANIFYYIIVFLCIEQAYVGMNLLAKSINKNWFIGVTPIFFGIISMLVDMAFIGIKDGIVYGVKKKKRKKQEAAMLEAEIAGVGGEGEKQEEEKVEEKSAEASALDRVTAEVMAEKAEKEQKAEVQSDKGADESEENNAE